MQLLPVEILRAILACCAADHLHTIAAVCHEWEKATRDRRGSIAKLWDVPLNIKNPLTCTSMWSNGTPIGYKGAIVFAEAVGSAALPSLLGLYLDENQIGNDGLAALATAVANGALPSLTVLDFDNNQIGDAGITAFASALGNGALPSLNELYLSSNQIGDTGLTALATALSNGALPLLTILSLYGNKFGDAGVTALAKVIDPKEGSGALPSLEIFDLGRNRIGDAGLYSLSTALGSGAMASLITLGVDDGNLNTEHHHVLQAACQARRIGLNLNV